MSTAGSFDRQNGIRIHAHVAFGMAVGLATASFLALLEGASELLSGLGIPPWQAHLLLSTAGFVVALQLYRWASFIHRDGGLTPLEALLQLRTDLEMSSDDGRRSDRPDAAPPTSVPG